MAAFTHAVGTLCGINGYPTVGQPLRKYFLLTEQRYKLEKPWLAYCWQTNSTISQDLQTTNNGPTIYIITIVLRTSSRSLTGPAVVISYETYLLDIQRTQIINYPFLFSLAKPADSLIGWAYALDVFLNLFPPSFILYSSIKRHKKSSAEYL